MKFITPVFVIIALSVVAYFVFRHHGQDYPGTISGVYYEDGSKGKVIIINDITQISHGGVKTAYTHYALSWLIELDATTGKELKRISTNELKYIGSDPGRLWMVSRDSNIQYHIRDIYSLDVLENYKPFLEKAQAQNPVFKDKIASWEADESSGNILITSFEGKKYYVNPLTFEAIESNGKNRGDATPQALSSVGMMKQSNDLSYIKSGKTIYQLDGENGQEVQNLFCVDECKYVEKRFSAVSGPDYVEKRHMITDKAFIYGAFVYDAYKGSPLCFEGDSGMFIYHLDRLGKGGRYMLTHVNFSGTVRTQYDVTQAKPEEQLLEAFIADGKLYLVFPECVQARDASGKIIWQYTEDTMTH